MMVRDNSHLYILTVINKISLINQIDMYFWSFIYWIVKNMLHYFLIGYVCSELIVRVFYDSIYIARKRNEYIWKVPLRKIDQYSFKTNEDNTEFIRNPNERITSGGYNITRSGNQGCCSTIWKDLINRLRKWITEIYTWENDFRFTTVVICTYTIAYVFLGHLTFNLVFFYTTDRRIYMTYLIELIERILNISKFC